MFSSSPLFFPLLLSPLPPLPLPPSLCIAMLFWQISVPAFRKLPSRLSTFERASSSPLPPHPLILRAHLFTDSIRPSPPTGSAVPLSSRIRQLSLLPLMAECFNFRPLSPYLTIVLFPFSFSMSSCLPRCSKTALPVPTLLATPHSLSCLFLCEPLPFLFRYRFSTGPFNRPRRWTPCALFFFFVRNLPPPIFLRPIVGALITALYRIYFALPHWSSEVFYLRPADRFPS